MRGRYAVPVAGRDDGIAATGRGVVHAVTGDAKLSMSHGPIPDIGRPAMSMDMTLLDGVGIGAVAPGDTVMR